MASSRLSKNLFLRIVNLESLIISKITLKYRLSKTVTRNKSNQTYSFLNEFLFEEIISIHGFGNNHGAVDKTPKRNSKPETVPVGDERKREDERREMIVLTFLLFLNL